MTKKIGLLLSLSVCFVLIGCSGYTKSVLGMGKRPSIKSISPRIAGIDFQGINLIFDLEVDNPYSVAIKSPRFKYGMDIQDNEFMKSETTSKLSLPAKGVGTVSLPVRMEYVTLWRTYQGLKGANEVPYTMRGAMVASALGKDIELPMEKSGVFPVMRVPRFSSTKVKTSDVSLTKAKVAVTAMVMNPNAFTLGLDELGYDIKIGDIVLGSVKATTLKKIAPGESREMTLTGALSGYQAVQQLLSGSKIGKAEIKPTGFMKTNYGKIKMP
jgi:LEA14-like dessication related protein